MRVLAFAAGGLCPCGPAGRCLSLFPGEGRDPEIMKRCNLRLWAPALAGEEGRGAHTRPELTRVCWPEVCSPVFKQSGDGYE